MNKSIATRAENGVYKGSFETDKGYCMRYMRQIDEAVEGTKHDEIWRGDGSARDATAARAGHRFLAAGLGFLAKDLAAHGGLQPGDMPVKTKVAPNRWGDFSGHIGAVCMDVKRIAENSSTSIGRVRGALGFRTLAQWGAFDIVIRLPDPADKIAVPIPIATPVVTSSVPLIINWNGNLLTMEQLIDRCGHTVEKITENLDAGRVYVHSHPNLGSGVS